MDFNLNGDEFKSQSVVIFNNGIAGKVENVSVKVEKKAPEDTGNSPDYQVVFTDENQAKVNLGIYYPNEQSTPGQTKMTVGKALAVARALVGNEYVFPEVKSTKEAVDICMKITSQNSENKKVNVFVTYGTNGAPKKYLGVYKNFDFIEAAGTIGSKLRRTFNSQPDRIQYNDLMERLVEDNVENVQNLFDSEEKSTTTANSDWLL